MTKKEKTAIDNKIFLIVATISGLIFSIYLVSAIDPTGPTSINITANETKAVLAAEMINITGGNISKINITASVQNDKWKAFLGWVQGSFSLDDSSGSTIYDWSLTTVQGQVYTTRQSTTVDWDNVACANTTEIEAEDTALIHTGEDNINSTFSGTNTGTYYVAGTLVSAGDCRATNTYDDGGAQALVFEEFIMRDDTNSGLVFATKIEDNETGYDASGYDFQMIVPENASGAWSSSTAYYLYVELT